MNNISTWLVPIVSGSRHIVLPLTGAAGIAVCIEAFSPPGRYRSGAAVSIPDWGAPWPDWLFAAVIMLCSSGLLLLFALFARLRRKRRSLESDAYEEVFEPPPVSPATGVLLLVTTALLVFVAVRALWSGRRDHTALARVGEQAASAPPVNALPALARAVTHSALASVAVGMVALLLAIFIFVFLWWLHFGGTRLRSAPSSAHDSRTLCRAVDESVDALRSGVDPRDAIIACYAGFERALAAAGLRRASSRTANEFARDASRKFRLPVDAVHNLAHLFELARFSEHPMDDGDRAAAWHALEAIRAALQAGSDHVPVS